ncbi:MAG: HlyD family efflux transporter periplasmic adaptor subunit [Bacillota bacterium]
MSEEVEVIQRKRVKKKTLTVYKLFFFFVIAWFIGSGLLNLAIGLLVNTEIVTVGMIEKKYPIKGYIIRDEIVVTSPVSGRIINRVNPGERVGLNMPIASVESTQGTALESGDPIQLYSPAAGIVSYVTDGLEEIFRPGQLQKLDIEKINKLKEEVIDNSQMDVVEKGKRLCKVVNNLEGMQVFLEFPLELFTEPLQKGQALALFFPKLERHITGSILDLTGIGETAQVLIAVPEVWYSLINERIIDIEIILEKKEGIIIPEKALVFKNEEPGVYWLRKGFVFWQPITVLAQEDENVIIEGIEPLTEVILNPGLVKEGQHIN